MSKEKDEKKTYAGFNVVMKWSGLFFSVLIVVGIIFRFLFPLELHLDENEYIERVFTSTNAEVFFEPEIHEPVWTLEGGEILYVIDEDSLFYQVRPFVRIPIDSVWILKEHTLPYSAENYGRWQYD